MRTTIELPDEQRGRLLELAARRGEKGFSGLIQAAVARFLEEEARREERVDKALAAIGSLNAREATALRESVSTLRRKWRSS